VHGHHETRGGRLGERVLGEQGGQLGDDLGMPAQCHLGVDPVGQHAPTFLVQVLGGLGELRDVVQARVCGPSPEPERLLEQRRGRLGVAPAERAPASFGQVREMPGVHLGVPREQRVPRAVVPYVVGVAERAAQAMYEHLEVLAGARREPLAPERVGQRLGRDRTAAPADEQAQKLFLAPGGQRHRAHAADDGYVTDDLELHGRFRVDRGAQPLAPLADGSFIRQASPGVTGAPPDMARSPDGVLAGRMPTFATLGDDSPC
jgi:hypothetical protein